MIYADISDGNLCINEIDLNDRLRSDKYVKLVNNLIATHYSRWGVSGYTARGSLGRIVRESGLIGDSEIEIRSKDDNPIIPRRTKVDFTLSLSSYMFEEAAIHNYLYINRLSSGMAVLAKDEDEDDFLVLGIIPKGVVISNTPCVHFPEFTDDFDQSPIIYEVAQAAVDLAEVARVMSTQCMLSTTSGEMASIVITQAYQRVVGARATIVDDDDVLVALAEMVRGSWSNDTGYRAAALMGAWVYSNGNPGRQDLTIAARRLLQFASSPDSRTRIDLHGSIASIWQWINLMNIHQGSNINSTRVTNILSLIGRNVRDGGAPTGIHNLKPKTIQEVREILNVNSLEDILLNARTLLFHPPPRVIDNEAILVAEDFDFGEGDF
jgi:hypothetical protein